MRRFGVAWLPFIVVTGLIVSATLWQNGGEALYRHLTGVVPWDGRERQAVKSIDTIVTSVAAQLDVTDILPEGGVIHGKYVAWVVGPDQRKTLPLDWAINRWDGGVAFINTYMPSGLPVCLGDGANEAGFAAQASSVVIIRPAAHETLEYPYVSKTRYPSLLQTEGRLTHSAKGTNYRLDVWVVNLATQRITAQTQIMPGPMPESFDMGAAYKDGDAVHIHFPAEDDTFPKLSEWLDSHCQSK